METGFNNSFSSGDEIEGQNSNFTNSAWDILDISTLRCYDYTNQSLPFGIGVGSSYAQHNNIPDPHMMCLKLGKRHYCDCFLATDLQSAGKRVKPPATVVPRCQVEGCHVALVDSKDYYKRHKVCEIHSKAPKVVVLGLLQRFCQQCSRFHGVREFDEAKRSCRRRLEGHNQRRRKGNLSNSIPRNFIHSHEINPKMECQIRPLSTIPLPPHSRPGCALSLLSSPKTEPWISSDDLSSRCSAALYELIAANRSTYVVGHFLNENGSSQQVVENTIHTLPQTQMWDQFSVAGPTNTTLDLMQTPGLDFGLLSMKEKSEDPEEWTNTDYCWSTFEDANIV